MPSRLEYLIKKLDDLEDDIRREKKEYDRCRDRYDKMRSWEILEDLRIQFSGYQSEHDQLQRARSDAQEKLRQNQRPPQQQQHQQHHPQRHPAAPPHPQQRSQKQAPPPPKHRTAYPHRPAPQQRPGYPPQNNYAPNGHTAGRPHGGGQQRTAPPRPRPITETIAYEVEEPDGTKYVERGIIRDYDPARDKVRGTL